MKVIVKTYSIRRNGPRGLQVFLPREYLEEVGLSATDRVDMYRDTKDPQALIIKPHID